MKRPVCLFALCYLLLHLLWLLYFQNKSHILPFVEGEKLCFVGKVDNKIQSEDGLVLYLKDIQFDADTKPKEIETEEQQENQTQQYRGAICYMSAGDAISDIQIPKLGSYILVEGIFKPFYEATNQGQFDQKSYYETQQIDFSVRNGKVLKETEDYYWLFEQLWLFKEKWKLTYGELCTEKEAGFLVSVILGDKKDLDTEVKTLFSQNGIAHILAVSGVHLSILGMGLYKLLKKLGLPEWSRVTGSIVTIILYGIMIHAGVATLRAILMFAINLCAKLIGRTYDMAVATSVSACIMVTGNGAILSNAGFVLSFMAILALLLFYPFIKNNFPISQWMCKYSIGKKVVDSFLISFSITFFLLPVQLYYYYEIYPYSIFLNLIVLPLFSIIIYLGFIGGIVGMFSPVLGSVFLLPCKCIFGFYQWVCEKTELLPANRMVMGKPDMGQIFLFYALILGMIWLAGNFKEKFHKEKLSLQKLRVVIVLICSVSCFILCKRWRWNTRIVFLDVGQGECCVIEEKSGVNILIDAGSSDVSGCGERRVIPYLKSRGISNIDYAFLSHPDSDHCSALIECMDEGGNGITVEKLVLTAYGKKYASYNEVISRTQAVGGQVLYIYPKEQLTIGGEGQNDFSLQCLFPSGDEGFSDTNEQSMILYGEIEGFSILFTGDMGEKEEQEFLAQYMSVQMEKNVEKERACSLGEIDLLKVAHHGSSTSTSEKFLQFFNPKVAIISCGAKNPYGHPHKETLDRLEEVGSVVLSTSEAGEIIVECGKEMRIRSFK